MNKYSNFFKSRTFIITLVLTFIALVVIGVTYAWVTWNSTENTKMTLKIGEYTIVSFLDGNIVNVNDLAPVYNYEDGKYTTFILSNSDYDTTREYEFNVYLDIISIDEELKSNAFKYLLLDESDNIIADGNFSGASPNATLAVAEAKKLPRGDSSYRFIIYLDGNKLNDSDMMNKALSANMRITAKKRNSNNLITEFTYAISSFNYNDKTISIPEGKVLLLKYNGNDKVVNIPSTYTINGVEYNTVLYGNKTGLQSTFYNNKNITEISFDDNVLFADLDNEESLTFNSMSILFAGCSFLTRVSAIPESVTKMNGTFDGCSNLEGTIRINSSDISLGEDNDIFNGTVNSIIVEVPEGSTTYNSFNGNLPNNVSLEPYK